MRQLSPRRTEARDRRLAAVHEAGHVVIALHLGYEPQAYIRPIGADDPTETKTWIGQAGMCMPPEAPPEHMRMVGIAGMVAEEVWRHRDPDCVEWFYWGDVLYDPACMSDSDWRWCGYEPGEEDHDLCDPAAEVARLLTGELWPLLVAESRDLITRGREQEAEWTAWSRRLKAKTRARKEAVG